LLVSACPVLLCLFPPILSWIFLSLNVLVIAICLPSGDHATVHAPEMALKSVFPVLGSHTCNEESPCPSGLLLVRLPPLTDPMSLPSGDHVTPFTWLV